MINFKKFLNLQEDYKGEHESPDSENGCPLYDLTLNGIYPLDFYDKYSIYMLEEFDNLNISVILGCHNRPKKSVIVYRAVPKILSKQEKINDILNQKRYILKNGRMPPGISSNFNSSKYYDKLCADLEVLETQPDFEESKLKINNGDWVTINKNYAIYHGKTNLKNEYRIIRKTVLAKNLFTDGNSLSEWGYWS